VMMAALEDRARMLRALVGYLAALVGREREGLLEVRWRHDGGMRRRVFRVADQLPGAAAQIVELGARTDVYVGFAPRRRRPGGHGALGSVWVLWVDCDTPAAVAALGRFSPTPAIVIRSGSAQNRHAYWTLHGPLSADEATLANRRLAHALGADSGAVTTAAAILRPPGTSNLRRSRSAPGHTGGVRPRATGLTAGRDGKVSCPFHGQDRSPSLHVYEDPAAGWYCFGCGRGGSIFDLGVERCSLGCAGIARHLVFCAHITAIVEPLLFVPAFIAVGWSLMRARRTQPPPEKEHP
jgi:hypothetical protein